MRISTNLASTSMQEWEKDPFAMSWMWYAIFLLSIYGNNTSEGSIYSKWNSIRRHHSLTLQHQGFELNTEMFFFK